MIGWTKKSKRCPEHGLTLRSKAEYCPACGKRLLCINLFPLFKIYISRGAALLFVLPLFFFGLLWTLGIPGCISGCNEHYAQEEAAASERRASIMESMPDFWKQRYVVLATFSAYGNRYESLLSQMENHENEYPQMNGEQMSMFLGIFGHYRDEVYPILMKVMREEG